MRLWVGLRDFPLAPPFLGNACRSSDGSADCRLEIEPGASIVVEAVGGLGVRLHLGKGLPLGIRGLGMQAAHARRLRTHRRPVDRIGVRFADPLKTVRVGSRSGP
jgi:hypothetical protein